jgi:hypothetical protein
VYCVLVGKTEGKKLLTRTNIRKKENGKTRTGLILLRMGIIVGLL